MRDTSCERMADLRHDCADMEVIAALPVVYSTGNSRIKEKSYKHNIWSEGFKIFLIAANKSVIR